EAQARALASLREAAAMLESATLTHADAELALSATAEEAGFADVPSALAAAVPNDELTRLQETVDDHARRLAAVSAVLDDPEAAAASAAEPPDLEAVASAHEAVAAELASTHAAERRESSRAIRLAQLEGRLARAVAAWGPVRAE